MSAPHFFTFQSGMKDSALTVGLQAAADYIGAELFTFFFGGDILGKSWNMGDMGGEKERARQYGLLDIALGLAGEI